AAFRPRLRRVIGEEARSLRARDARRLERRRGRAGARGAPQHHLDPPAPRSPRAARRHRRGGVMNRPVCTRAWQAEALEDGRLSGADRASFERHAASCAECSSELRALARLRPSAERLPVSTPTPLERRRQRQALLRRASELRQRAPAQPRRRTFAAFALSGALLAAVCIGFALRDSQSGSDASATPSAPTYRLDTSPGAAWQTIEDGATLRLRLASGSFSLAVDKLTAAQR